jgi:hypothetical protein
VATIPLLQTAGLYTSPNPLSAVPAGALFQADNCVMNYPGVLEPRRGFDYVGYGFGDTADRAPEITFYQTRALVQYGSTLAYDNGAGYTAYSGSFFPLSSAQRMRFVSAGGNLYFNTAAGVRVLDAYNGTPLEAGIPPGVTPLAKYIMGGVVGHLPGGGQGTWLPTGSQVAYVLVWGRQDANKHTKLGPPSGRVLYSAPSDFSADAGQLTHAGTACTVTLPSTGAGHGYQVGTQFRVAVDVADSGSFNSGAYTVLTVPDLYTFTYADGLTTSSAANTVAASFTVGKQSVSLAFDIPPWIDGTYFYRIYRTKSLATALSPDPGGEYYLVQESVFTPNELNVAHRVEWTDTAPDEYLTDPLYTNPRTGETDDSPVDKNNNRPPLCTDLALWNDRMWYAQTTSRHQLEITLLGIGAPNGLQAGDTITIAGIPYTASPDITATTNFYYPDATAIGLPANLTDAQKVEWTAQQLCIAVNTTSASPVVARYFSGPEDLPGRILLEEKGIGGDAFTVEVSRPSSWAPVLPETGGAATKLNTSDNSAMLHGVFFSKPGQHEAVGGLAYLTAGSQEKKVLRAVPLMDRLFLFKEDGIYVVTGDYPFRVTLLDSSAILLAPDTVQVVNNSIFALTTQGVVQVHGGGVAILGTPIELDVKKFFGAGLALLKQLAFGVSYESYRKYLLAMPTELTDASCTQQWVYDVATNAWTRWTKNITCARVHPTTDYLYLGNAGSNKLSVERKAYDKTDYADESFFQCVVAYSGKTLTLLGTAGINVGDLLYQSPGAQALVTSVVDFQTLTVDATATWATGVGGSSVEHFPGAVRVLPGIDCQAAYVPNTAGKPSLQKHWQQATFHLRDVGFNQATAYFSSELAPADSLVTFPPTAFGANAWGGFAWSLPATLQNRRVPVPLECARSSYLTVGMRVREAQSTWALCGVSLEVADGGGSERNSA